MSRWTALLSLLLSLQTALVHAEEADRTVRDAQARQAILDLNFFAEGGGMHLPPGILQLSEDLFPGPTKRPVNAVKSQVFTKRWGLNWDERPVGLFDLPYKGMTVGVLGCVACHSGKAAGQFIVGLGNKNIDVHAIGRDAFLAERLWKVIGGAKRKNPDYKYVEDGALSFAKTLSNPKVTNLTQGMVPTAVIRSWFYKQAGKPFPESIRAAVKVPAFWGYGEKRKVGQFCDGLGDGNHPGWGIAVELTANQRTDVVRGYLDKISNAEDVIGDLLPPKYPRGLNAERATRGKALFDKTCAGCHGTYDTDAKGLPVYVAPEYFDWEMVGTDRDRLNGNTPEFLDLIKTNPLNDVIRYNADKGQGYFAPRLVGIWARFPYLHNGSVPSISALLDPPSKRPVAFSLEEAGEAHRFDENTLGLTVPAAGSRSAKKLLRAGKRGRRDVYYTPRPGHSNQGHDFYTDLKPEERGELIEYLKTL